MTQSKITAVSKKRGKKYAEKLALIESNKHYNLEDAVQLLTQVSISTFDGTAEVHLHINADTTKADQLVRTTVVLPHGTGKKVRIAAFVPDDQADAAKSAGADIAGMSTLLPEVEKENIDFDIAIAVPEVMKDLGKVAKTLGQRGLMPNPKAGTVTTDLQKTIDELKKGRIECKMDKQGNIHAPFGKISFGTEKLKENLETVLQAIQEAQPAGIKGIFIKSVTITPSMGPGIAVSI